MRSSRWFAAAAASGSFLWCGVSSADVKTDVQADVLAAWHPGKQAQLQLGPGLGFGVGLGARFTGVPLAFLGSVSYFYEGSTLIERIADVPSGALRTTLDSYSLNSHLHARFQPFSSRLRPFVEGLLGVSRVNIGVEREMLDDTARRLTIPPHETSLSYLRSYGFGLGAQIQIRSHGPEHLTFLTFGFRYLTGGELHYPRAGSARANGDSVMSDTISMRNQTAIILVGLLHEFDVAASGASE
ncbi:MAG: hypothetical protein SFV15_05080 [Polyangiaceae bacterium]|nr:hypothetical protein [Polyangiaceae bacterium]